MPQVLTRLDLFSYGRNYVRTHAQRIDPRQADVAGSDINLYLGAASYMANAVALQDVDRIRALMLDGCEDEELDRWAFDRYTLVRKGAASAVGFVTFTRVTADAGAGSINVGTKLISLGNIEYVTLTTATFTSSSLVAIATVRAVQAGKEFQVGANHIRRFQAPEQVFDSSITLNNDDPTAGGEAAEPNDVFRERIRGFWRSVRRGTVGAIEYGALTVPGVESAQAIETLDACGRPDRYVELHIADSSGVASQALANLVDQALYDYRAAGIYVGIFLSRPQIVDVTFAPSFVAGIDTLTLSESIRTALLTFINSLKVNQPLLRNDLGAVLARFRAEGLIPKETTIVRPAGDLYPEVGRTLRARSENIQLAS